MWKKAGGRRARARALEKIAAPRGGVFSRAEAVQAGYPTTTLARRLVTGEWVEVHPGVYRFAAAKLDLRERAHAVLLYAGEGAVISHRLAASIWGILDARAAVPIEVLVPLTRHLRAGGLIVHRYRRLDARDRRNRRGLAVTSPGRTIIDLAPLLPGEELELVFERAFRKGLCTVADLREGIKRVGRGRRGLEKLTAHLQARLGDGTDSPLEDLLFGAIRRAGLPLPVKTVLYSKELNCAGRALRRRGACARRLAPAAAPTQPAVR